MDMKRKSFGRRESACAPILRATKITDNTKVPIQAVQQKPVAERINILRQDLGPSSLVDILKGMIRRR